MKSLCPWLRHLIADGGYAGPKLREALRKLGTWTIEIIKRSDHAKGFVLLPKRWAPDRVRGRTHACLARAQPQTVHTVKVNSGKFGLTCIDAQDNAGEPVALREDVITAELLDADVYANAGERMPQVVNSYA